MASNVALADSLSGMTFKKIIGMKTEFEKLLHAVSTYLIKTE